MKKSLCVMLLLYYGLAEAHVADFHFRGPSDLQFEMEIEKREEIERDQKILESPDASLEEKLEALDNLLDNGGIC